MPRSPHRFLLLAFGVASLTPALFAAKRVTAPAAKPDPAEPKPYVLYMGADLDVLRDKKYYRVETVTGSEFKIRVGKQELFIPTRNRSTSLRIDNSLKIAGASVQLDDLQSGPSYTPANDPMDKFVRASGAAAGAAAVRDLTYGKMISTEITLAAATHTLATTPENSPSYAMVKAAFDRATANYNDGVNVAIAGDQAMVSQEFDTPAAAERMNREKNEQNFDAMEVSFKVSSPVELDNPHLVVLFRFQTRDAKPGEEGLMVHAKELEPIGPKPKYIRIKEGGLPLGFKYVGCEVHLYNHGREVPTNLASKRVELTRAEAQEYLVLEHLGQHKGATVPAAVVRGTLPAAQRQRLSLDQLNRTLYAKVGVDGSLLGIFTDESCGLAVDDTVTREALAEVFFKPALDHGRPVEAAVRVRPGEI